MSKDEKGKIYITPVQNGTALDHLKQGTALKILGVLDIEDKKVGAAMNVDSRKMGKKDLVFIEGKELNQVEINKIALIGKGGTLNIIKNAKIIKKEEIKYPKEIEGIVNCINPMCITNKDHIEGKFTIISSKPLRIKCNYCETKMNEDEIIRLIK